MSKLVLTTLALIGLSAPAAAQQPVTVRASRVVDYSDLNLATARGIATLDGRINSAIRSVCRVSSDNNWMETIESSACRQVAWSDVRRQRDQAIIAYREGGSPVRLAVARR